MGNCVSLIKRKKEPSKAITLAIVGVDNAGKTTLCSVFAGESPDPDVAPTVGFRNIKFSQSDFDITVFDLGGGKNIRPIWKNYYGEVYGVIYVVDSSSPESLREAKEVLRETLQHPQISGKPVLILANKVDREGHMEEVDIVQGLKVEESVNANNCPSKMVMVSALRGTGSKMDKELQTGLNWLLDKVRSSLDTLEPRVQDDIRVAKEARNKEREERKARVKKQREERDKEEARERERLGLEKPPDSDDEDVIDGDPFKALDMATLTQKEEKLKEEKKKREELVKKFEQDSTIRGQSMDDSDLHSNENKFDLSLRSNPLLDRGDNSYTAMNLFNRRPRGSSTLPALEPLGSTSLDSVLKEKKKGKKKKKLTDYHIQDKDENELSLGSKDERFGKLRLSMSDSDTWNRDTGVHDLTPREAKPKKNRSVKAGRIEEDVNEEDLIKEKGMLEKNLYNIDTLRGGSYRQNKYDDVFPSKHVSRDIGRSSHRGSNLRELEREDSMYRNSLRRISPPNLTGFNEEEEEDEDKDEGIEDDSDNASEDAVDGYRQSRNARNYHVSSTKVKSNSRKSEEKPKTRQVLSDEEQEDYLSHSVLKDTMRFPKSPTDEEVPVDFRREMEKRFKKNQEKKKSRGGVENGGYSGSKGRRYGDDDDDEEEEEEMRYSTSRFKKSSALSPSEDDSDEKVRKSVERSDNPRKKKRNYLLRSNKTAPSDDDEGETAGSYRMTSPRMVQEHGSRNTSDADTPTKNRNSRLTHFHSNTSQNSDFSNKWGLAEDLPTVDNGNMRKFRTPNFDDSDGDIIF